MVYEPNGNMYEVGGNVREFMSRAIYGGRCMSTYNKKWCIESKPEVLNVINPGKVYNSIPDYL